MTNESHYRALENMYLVAPINRFFEPSIVVTEGRSEIEIDVSEQFFHSAGALHGSVYFKMLDDAAFFAANSLEFESFVLTLSFTVYLTRPVSSGVIRSVGTVSTQTRTQLIAEAVVFNASDEEIGRGNGLFVRGKVPLVDVPSYKRESHDPVQVIPPP